jgi:hypothetical protein
MDCSSSTKSKKKKRLRKPSVTNATDFSTSA